MKQNFIYQLVYQILTIIIPFITTPYVSRILGAEGIGLYAYTYACVGYFVLFGRMGIQMYGNRLIAIHNGDKNKISECFWNLFAVHLIFSGLSIIAYIFFVCSIKENKGILLIQGIYLIGQMLDINWLFFGLEKFKLTVTRNIIIKVLTLISIFVFVKSNGDLWKYILILALGAVLGESMIWATLPKYVKWKKPTLEKMKPHFKPIVKLFIPVIATSIYTMMDKLFIKHYRGVSQVGYYENAEKIVSVGRLATVALGTVALPNASKLLTGGRTKDLKKSINTSLFGAVWFAVGFTYGTAGIAKKFIPFFLGDKFEASINIVYVLIPCVLCWAIANVFRTQYVIPKQKDNVYINSQIIAAAINLVLNILLIPVYGTGGAAIGTVVAELTVCVVMIMASKEMLNMQHYFVKFIWLNIFGMIMYLIIKILENLDISVWICIIMQIVLGGVIYLMLSLIMIKHETRLKC